MAVTKDSEKSEKDTEKAAKNEPVNQEEKKEETVTLTISQIDKLIDARLKERTSSASGASELVELLTQALGKQNNQKIEKFDKAKYHDPEPGDLLEKAVVFWSQGFQYVIGDDRKNGLAIPAPLGVVDFKAQSSKRKQNGKEQQMLILCKHVCLSKKELAFLRNHTMYGIRFFEKVDDVESVDVRYATLIASYAQGLRNMDAIRVFDTARHLQIPITTDNPDTMRVVLAQHYAKADVERSEEAQKTNIRKEKKELLLQEAKVK